MEEKKSVGTKAVEWIENHPIGFVIILGCGMSLASAIIGKMPTRVIHRYIIKR